MAKNMPLSPRVPGAVAGGGVGSAVGYLAAWALGAYVFGGGTSASDATHAIASVPWPLLTVLLIFVPAVVSWAGGYLPRDLASDLYQAQQAEAGLAKAVGADPVEESNDVTLEAPADSADAGAVATGEAPPEEAK